MTHADHLREVEAIREKHREAHPEPVERCVSCAMWVDVERCLSEQTAARDEAVAGDRGAQLGLTDWVGEEIAIIGEAES